MILTQIRINNIHWVRFFKVRAKSRLSISHSVSPMFTHSGAIKIGISRSSMAISEPCAQMHNFQHQLGQLFLLLEKALKLHFWGPLITFQCDDTCNCSMFCMCTRSGSPTISCTRAVSNEKGLNTFTLFDAPSRAMCGWSWSWKGNQAHA